ISAPSVETTTRSKSPVARAHRTASAVRLTPPIRRRFFAGTPLLPMRAGTSARAGPSGIDQSLLDADVGRSQDVGDPLAGESVAEERRALVASVGDLPPRGGLDGAGVVADVDDVRPVLPPLLARADIHGRYAEKRAFAKRRARVADDTRRVVD